MKIDAVTLEVFNHRFSAIAEEMGVALCRSAFSPNIKERRDFSCALFDGAGAMVAQAAHIPVHLGAMPLSLRAAIAQRPMGPGDVVMLNDPYAGGTHLPDVTVVAPVFLRGTRRPFGYVANRAHHADIGGAAPGSMPLATEIYQEGLRLPPVRLVAGGQVVDDVLRLFLANTRVPDERRGDLLAQLAALRLGDRRLQELVEGGGRQRTAAAMAALQGYSARLMRAALRRLPAGTCHAVDWMDDDGTGSERIPIYVSVRLGQGQVVVDFAGTAPQVAGGINANYAVTLAAVLYVFQAVAASAIPANAGLLQPIRVVAPLGSLVNARFPAAVAGGNVETAQRIVDVLLKALAGVVPQQIPAASNGSMNNLALGGYDTARRRPFAYYETIGGGVGAGPHGPGASGMHTHMTNTLNTPVEALEAGYPLRVWRYGLRVGSGGRGRQRGGEGIVREVELLVPASVTLLTDRRRLRPYGLRHGGSAEPGRNLLRTRGPGGRLQTRRLPAKTNVTVSPGDRICILTPGGGGWG